MIVIMTEKQYKSALSRPIVEEAHLVIVAGENNKYSVQKNRFGNNRTNMSNNDVHLLIDAYLRLVTQ